MIDEKKIIEIPLASIPDEIEFALQTSHAKSKKSKTANTWQSGRSEFKKFTDLFPGDLAKNIVRYAARTFDIDLIDYDKIRTDNFLFKDKFDLSFNNRRIEVKSSIEKYTNNITTLINNRRFIVYPDREISDIIFQVFYVYDEQIGKSFFTDMDKLSDHDFIDKYKIMSKKSFVEKFLSYATKGLIMGFITKEIALKRMNAIFNYSNTNVNGDSRRKYIDIFINNGLQFSELKKYL